LTAPAVETYEAFLSTGSGSDRCTLEFAADTVRGVLRTRWMMQDDAIPVRCELRFAHQRTDPRHGLLEVMRVAIAGDDDTELTPVPIPSDDDALLPLTVEYLRMPPTVVHVHRESQLAAMRPMGFADWNEEFELLLLVDDTDGGWPDEPLWTHIRTHLDKAKLALIDPKP